VGAAKCGNPATGVGVQPDALERAADSFSVLSGDSPTQEADGSSSRGRRNVDSNKAMFPVQIELPSASRHRKNGDMRVSLRDLAT
jgi:hypothetical protein